MSTTPNVPPALTPDEWEVWYDGLSIDRPDRGGERPEDPYARGIEFSVMDE